MTDRSNVEYTLVGVNCNAFSIMGYVTSAMKAEGYSESEISEYVNEATKIDYDNLVNNSIEMLHRVNNKRRENTERED